MDENIHNIRQVDATECENRMSSFLKPIGQEEFEYISELVYHYCGINLHEGKKELVRARLCKRIRELGMDSFHEYCEYLKNHANVEEMHAILNILSTNLTSFFRENKHFEFLERELPGIFQIRQKDGNLRFRIWSTACSSGEEAYTLAIVVSEVLPQFPRMNVKILATDISSKMLETAINGVYPQEKIKGFPPYLKAKYCTYQNGNYSMTDEIKRMVIFRHLNVIGPWPFKGPFDVIFCRNMMIYFDKTTQLNLVQRFEEYLSPGGFLFVGHSESLVGIPHNLKYVEPTVYQK